jgi:c-di-GMP-binding flagellar brake protein YcgR
MVRERRRYFRCPVTVPALIRIKGNPEEVPCDTVNISEGGVSIHSPVLVESSVPQAMRLRLPGRSSQLATETSVRWRSPDGLVGLEFLNLPASQKSELQEWLAQKLEETLPESVAALFRSIAPSI